MMRGLGLEGMIMAVALSPAEKELESVVAIANYLLMYRGYQVIEKSVEDVRY